MNIIADTDRVALARKGVDLLVNHVTSLLNHQDHVVLAIPGGRSVADMFSLLKEEERIPWDKVHVFIVDERLVPITSEESNFKLAKESFIDVLIEKKRLPQENVHPFIYDESQEDDGIGAYEEELKRHGGKYDCIILGVGEDGHVGALFLHTTVTDTADYFIAFHDSPKPPPDRMTASLKLLQKASFALALFIGEGKRNAFEQFKDSNVSVEECPAKLINEIAHAYVLTDLEGGKK